MSFLSNTQNRMGLAACLVFGLFIQTTNALASVVTFEGVGPLPNEQMYTGPGGGRYWNGLEPPSGGTVNSSFTIGPATFLNSRSNFPGFGSFSNGFLYSNTTDTTTPGPDNQYSAFPGSGVDGSANYGVAFDGADRIEFSSPQTVASAYFTNTTYAALSMLNGDLFAKQFGGPTGDDEDFFLLTINGEDAMGASTGSVEFYLADFRFADNSLDYIVDEWTLVDLAILGEVSALTFEFSSSDVTSGFINTPTYFAIDNLTIVPLPAGVWLLGSALIGLASLTRRKAMT